MNIKLHLLTVLILATGVGCGKASDTTSTITTAATESEENARTVKLLHIYSVLSGNYGYSALYRCGEVQVAKLGEKKEVGFAVKTAEGNWEEKSAASFIKNTDDGKEEVWRVCDIWHGNPTPNQEQRDVKTFSKEFAVYLRVNGQVYWDNNRGRNFFIAENDEQSFL